MENFDRKNIDELLEIHQIRQYFPPSKFCAIWYINSQKAVTTKLRLWKQIKVLCLLYVHNFSMLHVCIHLNVHLVVSLHGTRYSYIRMWFMYPHPHIQDVKMLHIYNVASYVC